MNLLRNILFIHRHRTKTGINHITGDIHYGILGLIGAKSVLTIHDDYAIVKAKGGIIGRLYKWLFWIFLPVKLANKVVCISESTKVKIDRLSHNNKTIVIAHHVAGRGFVNTPYLFNKECPVVLQIGATYQKNLETTIKSLQNIKCRLRVIKKMTEEQHLLAKNLGVVYSNVFDLSDDEILDEYIKADIVVFPSLYEGFGMPIIEAQTMGRPLITSNLAPMNWVAGNGAVLLNNPEDAAEFKSCIKRIINDDVFRKSIIEKGFINARRFDINKGIEKYSEIYKKILC
ncbi:MAG: glycosyltransferase [Paludibacter sp.]|nr:glycosyltransferase [Paludibacter sp.]